MSLCQDQNHCRELLQSIIDGQTDINEHPGLLEQLSNCRACNGVFELDMLVRDKIKQHVPQVALPVGLIEDIKAKISQTAKV